MGADGKRESKAKTRAGNPRETTENHLALTETNTCNDECLLKACASRQEKPPFCYKNGAARHADIRDPYIFFISHSVNHARG